jgi:hypothetical protein
MSFQPGTAGPLQIAAFGFSLFVSAYFGAVSLLAPSSVLKGLAANAPDDEVTQALVKTISQDAGAHLLAFALLLFTMGLNNRLVFKVLTQVSFCLTGMHMWRLFGVAEIDQPLPRVQVTMRAGIFFFQFMLNLSAYVFYPAVGDSFVDRTARRIKANAKKNH